LDQAKPGRRRASTCWVRQPAAQGIFPGGDQFHSSTTARISAARTGLCGHLCGLGLGSFCRSATCEFSRL